jgi:hypothetical protein
VSVSKTLTHCILVEFPAAIAGRIFQFDCSRRGNGVNIINAGQAAPNRLAQSQRRDCGVNGDATFSFHHARTAIAIRVRGMRDLSIISQKLCPGGHVRALLVEPRRKNTLGANMKFYEIVGQFDAFVRELDAVCAHDPTLAAQIKEIARRHEVLNKQTPYAQSHADSPQRMEQFMDEARRCLEARASELDAGSPLNRAS